MSAVETWYASKCVGGYNAYCQIDGEYDIECLHLHATLDKARDCLARMRADIAYRSLVRSAYWAHRSSVEQDLSHIRARGGVSVPEPAKEEA